MKLSLQAIRGAFPDQDTGILNMSQEDLLALLDER